MRFFAILSMVCLGCTFQLNDENLTKIEQGTPRPFDVTIFEPGQSLYIHKPVYINFGFDPDGKDIIGSAVFLNQERIDSRDEGMEGFYFDPTKYADGTYTFTVEYYQKSFSGSLADKLGAEVFVYSNSCKVVIDNIPVPKLLINKYEVVDGKLVIHWPAYSDTLFTNYTIAYGNYQYEIVDPLITSLEVPQFGGGSITFRLTLRAKGDAVYNVESYAENFDFQIEPTNFDSLRIRWNGSPYTTTEGLILWFEGSVPVNQLNLPAGKSATDTLIYFPTPFPYHYTVRSQFGGLSNIGEMGTKTIASPVSNLIGNVVHVKPDGNLIGISYDFFRTGYDYVTFGSMASGTNAIAGSFGLSHDGKKLFRVNLLSSTTMSVEKFDPQTSLQIGTTKVVTIPAEPNQTIYSVAASNDEYVFVNYGGYNFNVLYHWPSGNITYQNVVSSAIGRPAWVANGGSMFFKFDAYADLTIDGPSTVTPTKMGSKALNLPHRNQYVYFDEEGAQVKLINFNDGVEQNSIPITGVVKKFCANEYNDIAIIVQKPSGSHWVEVYDLDSGALFGAKRINSSLYASTSIFNYNFQLTGNWFRIGHFTREHYFMKFDFPL